MTNNYRLFPNPTENILNISIPAYSQGNGSFIDILDLNGRKLLTEKSFGSSITQISINVSELSSAVYIVHLYDKESKLLWSSKFIKE